MSEGQSWQQSILGVLPSRKGAIALPSSNENAEEVGGDAVKQVDDITNELCDGINTTIDKPNS